MTEHDEREPEERAAHDPLLEEQEGKGYGAGEGEREEALEESEPPAEP